MKILIFIGIFWLVFMIKYLKIHQYVAIKIFKFLAPGQQPVRDIDSYLAESNDVTGKWTFILGNDYDYFGHNVDYNTKAEAILAALDAIKKSLSTEFVVGCWTRFVTPELKSSTYKITNITKYKKGRWQFCRKLLNSVGSLFL